MAASTILEANTHRRDAMKPPRRAFLQLMAAVAVLWTVPGTAMAQTYPMRPVRLIVGVAPGGTLDIVARLMGQWLSERLGQPFIIEDRPGAGTNIGTEAVARAPADGHTLLLVAPPNAINATLYEKLTFNFIRDIAPVAGISRVPLVMVVNPSVPGPFRSSSPMPRPTQARSVWRRAATGRRLMW